MLKSLPLLLCLLAPVALQEPDTVKEPESGHHYLLETTALGTKQAVKITGTGIREKTVFAVNVYSFALYIDQAKATELLAKWKGKTAKELQKDDALYTALLDDRLLKELRLRFCRDVDADDVRSAFEDSLEPRILEFKKVEAGTKAEKLAVLAEFRKLFTLDKVKNGNELRFAWHPGGKLHTSINGEVQAVIESPALCWAMFDVFLGKKPISSSGKKHLVDRIPDLIAATPEKNPDQPDKQ